MRAGRHWPLPGNKLWSRNPSKWTICGMSLSVSKDSGVVAPLFLSILVMAVVPLCAAFYLLDHAVQTSLNLGFNSSVVQALDTSSRNLKTLKHLDPQRQDRYREQFEAVERLQQVY